MNKSIFILAHEAGDVNFYPAYRYLMKNQWKSYKELKEEQEMHLRRAIRYCHENIPYYRKLFRRLGLSPDSIKTIGDLEKLPIQTKDTIRQNWEDFKPIKLNRIRHYPIITGGTTGTPMWFRLSKFDRFLSGAMLYRGWGYGDYKLGDKMIILGGTALGAGAKSYLITRAHEISRNIKRCNAFDWNDKDMEHHTRVVNDYKPRFIRGYASAVYSLAKWAQDNDIPVYSPDAVFTTAEKLYPAMREKIEEVFCCDVYDNYGLNDGGISAYECSEHKGMHIDMERSVMEIVDENGHQVEEGEGKILATSLHNDAMPFVRYDTGDIGHIIRDTCGCGRGYRLLEEVVGRSMDIFLTPEGRAVHGILFLYAFRNVTGVKEYQIVQEAIDRLVIKLVIEDGFDESQLDAIKEPIRARSESWNIEVKFVDKIERTGAGKYKFIVNKLYEKS